MKSSFWANMGTISSQDFLIVYWNSFLCMQPETCWQWIFSKHIRRNVTTASGRVSRPLQAYRPVHHLVSRYLATSRGPRCWRRRPRGQSLAEILHTATSSTTAALLEHFAAKYRTASRRPSRNCSTGTNAMEMWESSRNCSTYTNATEMWESSRNCRTDTNETKMWESRRNCSTDTSATKMWESRIVTDSLNISSLSRCGCK